jgi:opacity protein-like surface antigen
LLLEPHLLALMGLAAPAHAADLDEIIYAKELPVTKPVEIGSGWYLRGDLGYSVQTRGAATSSFRVQRRSSSHLREARRTIPQASTATGPGRWA